MTPAGRARGPSLPTVAALPRRPGPGCSRLGGQGARVWCGESQGEGACVCSGAHEPHQEGAWTGAAGARLGEGCGPALPPRPRETVGFAGERLGQVPGCAQRQGQAWDRWLGTQAAAQAQALCLLSVPERWLGTLLQDDKATRDVGVGIEGRVMEWEGGSQALSGADPSSWPGAFPSNQSRHPPPQGALGPPEELAPTGPRQRTVGLCACSAVCSDGCVHIWT